MGAWNEGPFDNDDASDLVADLSDGAPVDAPDALLAVLGQVVGADGYVEAPEMSRAVAAVAVVALSFDRTLPAPEWLSESWLAGLPPATAPLVGAAGELLGRAFEGVDNEWFELWNDAGLLEEVRARMAPYAAALDSAGRV